MTFNVASFEKKYVRRIRRSVESTESYLTAAFRELASDWPPEVTSQIVVKYDDGRFEPVWPEALESTVTRLEFGGDEPSGVLHRFRNRANGYASHVIQKHLRGEL